ncbi:MAG TPA: D-glucuronyl C5-epimerase family protein [Solirubrobacteraceae bacterium]|nr:D-glucuronyl C5-epimerase family protein [Solirubrobacteraceae bacterium]
MRRTPIGGLLPALLLALVLAPSASASPLLTLRPDGTTFTRDDRTLPAAQGLLAPARAVGRSRTAPAPRLSARAAAARRTVPGELARMLAAGVIDQAVHDDRRAIYGDALRLRGKLSGARRAALGAVLRNLEDVAASGGLTVSRLPALFETVRRNREWWSKGPLLRHGARVSFSGSRIVWQFYAGEGLQIQWLGTFGKANGLWQGGFDAGLRALLDETLALAAQRAGGIAWEYLFRFDGGRPPWVSGLAQGTALQAFSRAAARFGEPRYFEAARAGLGIFRVAPPTGVRVPTPVGAHYLIYSFAPRLRVLNGFTQALNGLHDFAVLANDGEGHALFGAGEAQLREELAQYDTGGWSRYALGGRDADVSYHTLARDFLRNLCERLTDDAARVTQPPVPPGTAVGGVAPVPGAAPVPAPPAVLDPGPYCAAGERWTQYLTRPPVVKLVSRRARGGKPAVLKISVSKPSNVTLRVRRGARTVIVLGGNLGSGVRALRWPRPPRAAATYKVLLHAQDLTGRRATGEATLKLLKARRSSR